MRLKKNIIEELRRNPGIRGRLCADLGKSYPTVQRWVEENHTMLTTAAALRIISEEMGLTNDEILEEEPKTAV